MCQIEVHRLEFSGIFFQMFLIWGCLNLQVWSLQTKANYRLIVFNFCVKFRTHN